MEWSLPLTEGGIRRGSVVCRDEGCYVQFTVDAPMWSSGMKKVWLISPGGGRLLLGTLEPVEQRLRLSRRFSQSALRCCGMSRPAQGVVNPGSGAEPPPEGWQPLSTLVTEEPVLMEGLRQLRSGSWRRRDGCLEIRVPWRAGQPLPLMGLFCLGREEDGCWLVKMKEEKAEPDAQP